MRRILALVYRLLLVPLALALLIPLSHAEEDHDYARFASDWSDVHQSIPRAVTIITYARSAAARNAGLADLEAAAMRGSDLAAQQLAFGYLVGAHGLPVDRERSQRYFEYAVRQESTDALFDYGLLLTAGHRFDIDTQRGPSFIRRAAELGHPAAIAFLIEELEAVGDAASRAEAEAWRRRAGVRMTRVGGYTEDEDMRARMLASGYAQLGEYLTDDVMLPADPARALQYASRIPDEQRGAAAEYVATGFMLASDLRADHRRARAIFAGAQESLGHWGINNYAWLLSMSPDSAARNGEAAVSLMEDLLAREDRQPAWVDTLAAAYAEVGNFERAIELQDEALTGFEEDRDTYFQAVERREGYSRERAWRE